MNVGLVILGVFLIALGCSTGLWIPFPVSIAFSIIFGFAGGWLISEGMFN